MRAFSLRPLIAVLAAAFVLAACGGKDDEPAAAAKSETSAKAAKESTDSAGGAAADADAGLANAVIVGKTSAPITLKYDVAAKPQAQQPVEIELTFLPRQPGDALEATITGMPGLTVVSGGAARFEAVEAGGRYVAKVLAQADASGLYYIGVVAKLSSKVQTDSRTFSIPLAVGDVTTAQKPAPARDAGGAPIESMPATETVESEPAGTGS
jgi:hypothetical protein